MKHDRLMPLTIGAHILKIESFRKIEVTLDSGKLPRPADRILHIDINFWAIKRGVAFFHCIAESVTFKGLLQRCSCLIPNVVSPDVFLWIFRRQIERELFETKCSQN